MVMIEDNRRKTCNSVLDCRGGGNNLIINVLQILTFTTNPFYINNKINNFYLMT